MYQHQICIGTNEPEPGARQRPRRQVLALSRGWGRAEPRRSHPAADAARLPSSGRTHRTRAAVVAGLSRTERPRRGCSRDLPPPPRRAGAAPGQGMAGRVCTPHLRRPAPRRLLCGPRFPRHGTLLSPSTIRFLEGAGFVPAPQRRNQTLGVFLPHLGVRVLSLAPPPTSRYLPGPRGRG